MVGACLHPAPFSRKAPVPLEGQGPTCQDVQLSNDAYDALPDLNKGVRHVHDLGAAARGGGRSG
jgi:hypothetical protein